MTPLKKSFLVAVTMLALDFPLYAGADQPTEAMFKNIMTATLANDYDGFTAECDATMKAALTKQMLEGVSEQIAPRAKQGYESTYLGDLDQHGFKVSLWRLRFKDGHDDVLATMSVKDGKVGGFYLR